MNSRPALNRPLANFQPGLSQRPLMNFQLCLFWPRRLVVNFLPKWSSPKCVNPCFRSGCQLCSGGSRLHLLHRNRLLLCSGGLQSHLIHRGGCQLCSGGPRLCLIHRGGCQLCTGVLQFHSGSMLHWLASVLCLRMNKAYQHYTDLAYHPAPFRLPSTTHSTVSCGRLEAASWGGAMSWSVSWLTTRGCQTHAHHMDFILNSISHHVTENCALLCGNTNHGELYHDLSSNR